MRRKEPPFPFYSIINGQPRVRTFHYFPFNPCKTDREHKVPLVFWCLSTFHGTSNRKCLWKRANVLFLHRSDRDKHLGGANRADHGTDLITFPDNDLGCDPHSRMDHFGCQNIGHSMHCPVNLCLNSVLGLILVLGLNLALSLNLALKLNSAFSSHLPLSSHFTRKSFLAIKHPNPFL